MNSWLIIISIAILVNIAELIIIHKLYPKKIELKAIDGTPTAIVYSKYFFLPFTTKIRQYKNIEEAYVRKKIKRRHRKYSHSTYEVYYDLILRYSQNKTKILFYEKWNEKEILKYCEQINQFKISLEDTVINENKSKYGNVVIIVAMLIIPLFLFIHADGIDIIEYTTDEVYVFFHRICLIATGILVMFLLSSLVVNYFMYSSKKKKFMMPTKTNNNANKSIEINKNNISNDTEAKKIYDSIIK